MKNKKETFTLQELQEKSNNAFIRGYNIGLNAGISAGLEMESARAVLNTEILQSIEVPDIKKVNKNE